MTWFLETMARGLLLALTVVAVLSAVLFLIWLCTLPWVGPIVGFLLFVFIMGVVTTPPHPGSYY